MLVTNITSVLRAMSLKFWLYQFCFYGGGALMMASRGCEEFSKVLNTKIICMNSLLFVENFEVVFNELRI